MVSQPRPVGVVAAEVDRLAHLGHAVAQGLVRFLHQQAAELGQARFQQLGRAAQQRGALGHRPRSSPASRPAGGPWRRPPRRRWPSGTGHDDGAHHAGQQRRAHARAGQVHAHRIAPAVAVQRHRQRLPGHRRGRPAARPAARCTATLVGQLVHEGRVGAVLQQPAHQVGQQVAVFAHRRVDAAGDGLVLQHLAVDAFAHAVQALHLEGRAGRARHLHDGGDGAGVVAGELRVDHLVVADQRLRRRPGRQMSVWRLCVNTG
jgi:hypothetical protein